MVTGVTRTVATLSVDPMNCLIYFVELIVVMGVTRTAATLSVDLMSC